MNRINFDIGELFIVGFHGTSLDGDLQDFLTRNSYGGVILFSRNITSFEQWNTLTTSLQELQKSRDKLPYFIAIDEEGGTVSRMPDDGATLPGARALAQTGDPHLASTCGSIAGNTLHAMGCNLNLAPVLDVNVNPMNPGIGIRSFGDDPHRVSMYATAFYRGMKDAGILACAKHFPGKGDILRDSHKTLPTCSCTKDQIEDTHLPPFISAIREHIPCVMTSHARYPAIDPDNPGTLSKDILSGMLRKELKFSGLILSDDLEMGAMRECGSIGETAYRAIMAGCDMLLICHTRQQIEEAQEYLRAKMTTDKSLRNRCEDAYGRIQNIKKDLSWPKKISKFDLPIHATAHAIAKKAVTRYRDVSSLLPITDIDSDKPILLCGSQFRSAVEVEIIGRTPYDINDLHRHLAQNVKHIRLLSWDLSPEQSVVDTIKGHDFNQYSLIILCSNNAGLFAPQKDIIEHILHHANDRTILVAVKNPEDIDLFPKAPTAIATCGYNRVNIESLVDLLCAIHGHSVTTG